MFSHVSMLVQCTTARNDPTGFIFPGHEGNFQERFMQLSAKAYARHNSCGNWKKRTWGWMPHTHISTLLFPRFTLVQPKSFHLNMFIQNGGKRVKAMIKWCVCKHMTTHSHKRVAVLVFIGGSPGGGGQRLWRGSITNCGVWFMYVWSKSSTVGSCGLINTEAAWNFHQISTQISRVRTDAVQKWDAAYNRSTKNWKLGLLQGSCESLP